MERLINGVAFVSIAGRSPLTNQGRGFALGMISMLRTLLSTAHSHLYNDIRYALALQHSAFFAS